MVPPASTIDFASSATSRKDSDGARSMYLRVTSTRVVCGGAVAEDFVDVALDGAEEVAGAEEVIVSAVRRTRPSRSALARERMKSWMRWRLRVALERSA